MWAYNTFMECIPDRWSNGIPKSITKQRVSYLIERVRNYVLAWFDFISLGVRLSSLFWHRIKVSKRLLRGILQMIKRKAVLIRGLETPFWNAEKKCDVEIINAKLFWNAFISLTDLRKGVCPTWSLLYGSNCTMQLRSDKAFFSTRTRDRVRW